MRKPKLIKQLLLSLSLITVTSAGVAQENYPSKPITIVSPYPAGGVTDLLTRVLARELEPKLNVPIIVENKPGGGASIGSVAVARSAPDGYTWLIATTVNSANMSLMSNPRYDVLKDFVPIAQFGTSINYFVVPSDSPASSIKDYVAMAKAEPGVLTYGSSGIGSTPYLGFELFKYEAGIDVVAAQYKGAPPVVPDLIAGRLSAALLPSVLVTSQANQGRFKVLAATGEHRTSSFPDVPTMAEAGYPDASVSPWFVILAPAKTPSKNIEYLQAHIQNALKSPDLILKFNTSGAVPYFRSSEESAKMLQQDVMLWKNLVKEAGLQVN